MSENQVQDVQDDSSQSFREEFLEYWAKIPSKILFFTLFGAWILLFQFMGNSTLGYIDSPSLFGWLHYAYENSEDDQHGYLIPFLVLGLLWWKRDDLLKVQTRLWWPAMAMLVFCILLHVAGFMVQQTRLSVVGFFMGIYALMGLVWGPQLMRATFFPMFIFTFCLPLAAPLEPLTFKLRLLATQITSFLSSGVLGINVICDGTLIKDANGTYSYEVAAACSGIRSMTATVATALIFGFALFRSPWRRAVMFLSAFPLAVLANVIRLSIIIIAAETFGQSAGNEVHDNSWLSLLPYIPALGGVFLLAHLLREKDPDKATGLGSGPNDASGKPTANPGPLPLVGNSTTRISKELG